MRGRPSAHREGTLAPAVTRELRRVNVMRILQIVEATTAGVRRHVHVLVCGIDRQSFQVAVACPPRREPSFGDERFVADVRRAGVTVLPVDMRRPVAPAADARALRHLVTLIRGGQYDIVHTHSSKAGFLGRLAARIAGSTATVHTPHSLYFLGLRSTPKRRFYLALEQFAGRLSDRIIAVSPGERDLLLQHGIGSPDRVVWIANGIPPVVLPRGYDRAAQRRMLGQAGDGLLIGTVARLTEQKNPLLFVEAAALVLRDLPDARFVWCGGGELAAAAQARAAALGIAHACCFPGHRDDAEAITAALDLFWLTSDYEGLPYALLEAMALHVPIVATDVVGSRDVLGGSAGLLVPPRDARRLAQATLMLARRPDRRAALARAGYARFREQGTADRMLRAIERLYTELVPMPIHPIHAEALLDRLPYPAQARRKEVGR